MTCQSAPPQCGPRESLQFGHGTDAVDDLDGPLKDLGPVFELQFGHGTDAVDDATSSTGPGNGPGRFNSATALTPWMTPAKVSRAGEAALLLQFGHGTDAVDDPVPGS